ncbi:MAG: TatD family hydrolase [Bacteroidales bacterium]|nr:TatD family hydrolase [Bacteroidales bacterium]MBQ5539159.1 TatD family hydrolase [Bacteroidales bacterium]MEE3447390.1 TatD family hydrolase [Bacteroidales bacterium]
MYLFDTHTHFFDEAFNEDRDEAVLKAVLSGVEKMVLPCCSEKSLSGIEELCKKFPENCFPTLGLHPEDIDIKNVDNQLKEIFDFKFSKPAVAVGEIGIDLHYMKDTFEIQKKVFEYQLNIAVKRNLPVIIHCREAYKEIFEILDGYKDSVKGIFHCFSSDKKDAEKILNDFKNFYFGIGGVVTFKNSGKELAETVRDFLPLEKIVLETDSPYLAPVPNRGKRNESSFVRFVAEKIAELKNIDIQTVIETTTLNAENIFKI